MYVRCHVMPPFCVAIIRSMLSSMNVSATELVKYLPAVAYRFTGGPWRNLWIRYGYDPRKELDARMYVMGWDVEALICMGMNACEWEWKWECGGNVSCPFLSC